MGRLFRWDVLPRYISSFIDGEGQDIAWMKVPACKTWISLVDDGDRQGRQFFTGPYLTIHNYAWPVEKALPRISMNPSLLMLRIDFNPEVVDVCPDPTHLGAQGSAEQAEAVGPFARIASPGLQKLGRVCIAYAIFNVATGLALVSLFYGPGPSLRWGPCHLRQSLCFLSAF